MTAPSAIKAPAPDPSGFEQLTVKGVAGSPLPSAAVVLDADMVLVAANCRAEDMLQSYPASGKGALKALKAGKFDAIVSDIWMPEMDGIALLKEIRGAGNDIPVVVIPGGAPNAPLTYTAPLAATLGANVVVYKPFEKAELLKAIETVLAD